MDREVIQDVWQSKDCDHVKTYEALVQLQHDSDTVSSKSGLSADSEDSHCISDGSSELGKHSCQSDKESCHEDSGNSLSCSEELSIASAHSREKLEQDPSWVWEQDFADCKQYESGSSNSVSEGSGNENDQGPSTIRIFDIHRNTTAGSVVMVMVGDNVQPTPATVITYT